MNQKEYWKSKWEISENRSANNFARRSFSLINKKRLKTILDLGCGDGRDSFYFARNGMKVTAIDFSESGIEKLKREVDGKNIDARLMDIRKLNFSNSSFDVIYAHLILQYFDDKTTTKIFNKLYKILKKNGLFFVKCKSTDDALYGKGKKIGNNMYILDNHIRHFFDMNYMKEKLRDFKILKIRKTSSVYHKYKSSFIEAIATK